MGGPGQVVRCANRPTGPGRGGAVYCIDKRVEIIPRARVAAARPASSQTARGSSELVDVLVAGVAALGDAGLDRHHRVHRVLAAPMRGRV